MHVAIPVWQERVSPVFDTARSLLLVRVADGRELERKTINLVESWPPLRVARMRELGVDVLVCGAISQPLARLCQAAGVRLVPWVTGMVDEVLVELLAGRLPAPEFTMPGCCGGRRRRGRAAGPAGRRRGGGGRGRGGRSRGAQDT